MLEVDLGVGDDPGVVVDGAFDSAPLPGDTVSFSEGVDVLQGGTLEHVMTDLLTDMTAFGDQAVDLSEPVLTALATGVTQEQVGVGALSSVQLRLAAHDVDAAVERSSAVTVKLANVVLFSRSEHLTTADVLLIKFLHEII